MADNKSKDPAFAERLRSLLKQKGIKNNNRFAKAINRGPMVTAGWLQGKIPRLQGDWKILCDFFDVSSDFLFLGKGKEKEESPCRITVTNPTHDPEKGVSTEGATSIAFRIDLENCRAIIAETSLKLLLTPARPLKNPSMEIPGEEETPL